MLSGATIGDPDDCRPASHNHPDDLPEPGPDWPGWDVIARRTESNLWKRFVLGEFPPEPAMFSEADVPGVYELLTLVDATGTAGIERKALTAFSFLQIRRLEHAGLVAEVLVHYAPYLARGTGRFVATPEGRQVLQDHDRGIAFLRGLRYSPRTRVVSSCAPLEKNPSTSGGPL